MGGLWAIGSLNPLLLPPPHIILQDIPGTLKFFDRSNKVGTLATGGGVLGAAGDDRLDHHAGDPWPDLRLCRRCAVGAAIHYSRWARRLLLPTMLMLAPISPVAWLPVAIFVFGIGDMPAIFLVFVTVFFAIMLSVGAQIESVPKPLYPCRPHHGGDPAADLLARDFPGHPAEPVLTLRLNLLRRWMVVLIAEAVGVGAGLGQITSMARSTFNSRLVFFTMAVIGAEGFLFDFTLRQIQQRCSGGSRRTAEPAGEKLPPSQSAPRRKSG